VAWIRRARSDRSNGRSSPSHWSLCRRSARFELAGEFAELGPLLDPASVCRTLAPSSLVPEGTDSLQREFNDACYWTKHVLQVPVDYTSVGVAALAAAVGSYPRVDNAGLAYTGATARGLAGRLASQARILGNAESSLQHSFLEGLSAELAPFLLAFALALRITKVSGELALMRVARQSDLRRPSDDSALPPDANAGTRTRTGCPPATEL
jgi:hypothetical protein